MLKKERNKTMLNALFNEIASRLGDKYALYKEFNPAVFQNEEILSTYKNVGVLFVNNGNLGKLPDSAMMDISYTLELFMRVNDTVVLSDVITEDLVGLATGTTGKIVTQASPDTPPITTQVIFDTGFPTSDGNILYGDDGNNWIRYEVPISVVLTNDVALSKLDDISITIGGTSYLLKSVLSAVEVPQTQLETVSFTNAVTQNGVTYPAMQNESFVVAYGWGMQIIKLYRPAEDAAIKNAFTNNPMQPVTITIGNGENAESHTVVFHDCNVAKELGQAVVMTINVSTAMRSV